MPPDLPHPDDPRLLQVLMALAVCGRVHVAEDALTVWLRSTCLIDADGNIDPRWAEQLPARNDRDLLRIAFLRDPRYRQHLDGGIAQVLERIAASNNWQRLEDLLRGPLRPLAPRLAGILLTQRLAGQPVAKLMDYCAWNQVLWGNPRIEDALAVIADIYPRFESLSVGWSIDFCDATLQPIADQIIAANLSGEPVMAADIDNSAVYTLIAAGFPVVPIDLDQGAASGWCLSLRLDCATIPSPSPEHGYSWPVSVPDTCRVSGPSFLRPARTTDFIVASDSVIATLGCDTRSGYWPGDADQPDWCAQVPTGAWLPTRNDLHVTGLNPTAVRAIANHPIYGLIIQTLIQDALDGAFGEDRLVLAPRLDHHVDYLEANTAVLYRPDRERGNERQMLELGLFDEVFDELARHLGIHAVPRVFDGQQLAWSYAFAMLRRFGWIDDNGRRWRLAEPVFDRLHGAGLMAEVIRQARGFREERLMPAFYAIWQAKHEGTVHA